MTKSKPEKVLRVDFYEEDAFRFQEIKKKLAIRSDTDVIRYIVARMYEAIFFGSSPQNLIIGEIELNDDEYEQIIKINKEMEEGMGVEYTPGMRF